MTNTNSRLTSQPPNEITILDGNPELGLSIKSNEAWVSSRKLATNFGKVHKNVLADIRKIKQHVSPQFWSSNFKSKTYKSRGKSYKMFSLTFDGYSMVVMGFTGPKAMSFKEQYIREFNIMRYLITTRIMSRDGYKRLSSIVARNIGRTQDDFKNEITMINEIVLGLRSSEYKKLHNIDTNTSLRDAISKDELERINSAQLANSKLIADDCPFEERKRILTMCFGMNIVVDGVQ
jgi:Rha family phage regulatory protein